MSYCAEYSDSDDSALSDDCDYHNFKEHVKNIHKQRLTLQNNNQEDQRNQHLKLLFTALASGNVQNVVEQIDNGLDVNVIVQDGWTPLQLAASFGNPDLVRVLIQKGADLNLDKELCTPLMMACNCPETTAPLEKSLDVVKQLVENGANVKAVNRRRMSALMFAASNGNLEAVKYLLPQSDKNAEDNQRWTALFWAVNSNQLSVTKYLLEQGFEYTNSDIRSNTPLDMAKYYDFTEIVELFPKDETDLISNIIDSHSYGFENIFSGLKKGEKPKFILDICNILCGVKAESVIKIISESDIDLYTLLSTSDEELKKLGVNLPYQRNRILGGLYKFHKHPFHLKSLHTIPLKEVYSNHDMAIQLLGIIKQVIAMEASVAFIMKNYSDNDTDKVELPLVAKNMEAIQMKITSCKTTLTKLRGKTENLDKLIKPADLITARTRAYLLPWRKILLSFTVFSLIVVFKIK